MPAPVTDNDELDDALADNVLVSDFRASTTTALPELEALL